jgi:phage regulator Rha-like protein
MKEDVVVQLYNGEPRTNSRLVAVGFELTHRAIVNHIQKYRVEFEDFGDLPVEVFKAKKENQFGTTNTELIPKKRGVKEKSYWLNEEQFMFLGTLVDNSPISVKFKHKLIKDYAKCRKLLASIGKAQSTEQWQKLRLEGKTKRLEETNAIKEFVQYAKDQGSSNPEEYYRAISKMENAIMFIVAGKFKNLRDVLTDGQLMTIGVADKIIEKAIYEGMGASLFYKDVFQLAKSRVQQLAAIHGQSEVVQVMLE